MTYNKIDTIKNFIKISDNPIIVINKKDDILYASNKFLEILNLKLTDVLNIKYKNILKFDILYNTFYISHKNNRLYLTELSVDVNNFHHKVFIFCKRISENFHSDFIHNSNSNILFVYNLNHQIIDYNNVAYKFLNLKKESVINKECFKIFGKTEICHDCPISQSLVTGKITQSIKYFSEIDKWFDIIAYPIKNETGNTTHIIEQLKDISKQRQIEQKLIDNRLKINQLIENIPGIVYQCKNDINWTMLFMSHETQRLTGYCPEDFIQNKNLTYEKIIHPNDKVRVRNTIKQSILKNKSFIVEYRIVTKQKEIKYVWEKGKLITLNQDTCIDGIILDISERKKIETELRDSEEKHRLIIENQNELIIKLDKYGRFIYANKAYCNYFAKKEDEIISNSFMPNIHDDDKEKTNKSMMQLKQYPHSCYLEHRAMTINGWKWIAWSNKAVLNNNNEIMEIICVGRDITDNKIMEFEIINAKENAERNNFLKTIFLNNVIQKIQNPLTKLSNIINNSTNISFSEISKNETTNIINNLLNYINNLSEIAIIEAGKLKTNYEAFDLCILLENIYNKFKKANELSNINFFLKKNIQEPYIIKNDKTKIAQILTHLLSNAFNYTNKGKIELECQTFDNSIIFKIKDTGIGISKYKLDALFDLNEISKLNDNETFGFGLQISKAYVNLLGGNMNIDSHKDIGTSIKIEIPIKHKLDSSTNINNAIPDLNSHQVLVAEDEKINFQLIKTILTKAGATVLWAQTGKEAIEIIKNNKNISLVLMDIKMPNLSGSDALIEIRKINKDLKIIACTAFSQSDDSCNFSINKFDEFLPKPIKRKDLFKKINKLLCF